MPKSVLIAGVPVLLRGTTPAAEADLVGALDRAVPTSETTVLTITCAPHEIHVPESEPTRVVQQISIWEQPTRTTLWLTRGAAAEVAEVEAVVDPRDLGERGVHALMLPVLSEILPTTVVHCGAFLDDHGRAVLLLGATGRGKSTAVAAVLATGGQVLSDDLVALRESGGVLECAGLPLPLALPPHLLPQGGGVSYQGDPRARVRPAVGPIREGWHPVAHIVLVDHSEQEEGHLATADAREVLHGVINATLQGLHPDTVKDVFGLAALASRSPGWHLGHAADERVRVDAAARWLRSLGAEQIQPSQL